MPGSGWSMPSEAPQCTSLHKTPDSYILKETGFEKQNGDGITEHGGNA